MLRQLDRFSPNFRLAVIRERAGQSTCATGNTRKVVGRLSLNNRSIVRNT